MRLFIATGIYPPDHGGPARYVPLLARAAVRRGWSVRVLTLADVDSTFGRTQEDGVRVVAVPRNMNRAKRVSLTARYIFRGLTDADVMFGNGLYEESAIASSILKKPWVAKVVSDPIWERASNLAKTHKSVQDFQLEPLHGSLKAQRRALTLALSRCFQVVTPSAQLASIIQRWGVREPIVIPNGVEVQPERSRNRDFDVVTVGRLVPVKGLQVLIRACVAGGLSLLIAGDGPQRGDLEALISDLNAEALVQLVGAVEAGEVPNLLERASVFALNSSHEGMSFSLLEARERGLPSVVGRNAGNVFVVRDGIDAVVVNPQSEEEVMNALLALMSEPERAEAMGALARADVIERFSIERSLTETLDLLEEAAGG